MMSLQVGDVVWVEFPHVKTNRIASRPALIVSVPTLGPKNDLAWMVMITNAANAHWPGDITVNDFKAVGLPIPSVIRTEKVATLEVASANYVGRLPKALWLHVRNAIEAHISVQ